MAKLNGVKTIDMVNGEITKVAYDGAEYALVGDRAQKGDLLLPKIQLNDVVKGAFYECTGAYLFGINFRDDGGSGRDRNHGEFEVFRKISAQTAPTIEERVEELEAEVAQLKAHQTESKPKLKAGDFIKFAERRLGITAGKVYEVIDDETYGLVVRDDRGSLDIGHRNGRKYEILSAEEAAKHRESEKWAKIGRKPGEFKRGDIVRVLAHKHGRKIGEIGVIENPGIIRKTGIGIRFGDRQFVAITESNEEAELITPVYARFDK